MLTNTHPWDTFPKHSIDLSSLTVPAEITHYFKAHSIDRYVYCITFKDVVLKFGMSAASADTREWGERVYRQLGHCRSWGVNRISGASGAEWNEIEFDFLLKYGIGLDHKDIVLKIWDVTNYDYVSHNPKLEVEKMEAELIHNYTAMTGIKPIGNKQTGARNVSRGYVKTATIASLFTFAA